MATFDYCYRSCCFVRILAILMCSAKLINFVVEVSSVVLAKRDALKWQNCMTKIHSFTARHDTFGKERKKYLPKLLNYYYLMASLSHRNRRYYHHLHAYAAKPDPNFQPTMMDSPANYLHHYCSKSNQNINEISLDIKQTYFALENWRVCLTYKSSMHDSLAYPLNDTIVHHSNFHVTVYFEILSKYPLVHRVALSFGNLKKMERH